jgi:hypothetical protein
MMKTGDKMPRTPEHKTSFCFNMTAIVSAGNSDEEIVFKMPLGDVIDILAGDQTDEYREQCKEKLWVLASESLEKERLDAESREY